MSEKSRSAVDCPVCETAFDPTAAGGWCTNPECGEWRYERTTDGDESDASSNDTGDTSSNDTDDTSSNDNPEGRASAVVEEMFQPSSYDPEPESEPQIDGGSVEESQADEEPGEASREGEQDAGGEPPEPTVECPECGETIDPEDSFCASCGTDLADPEAPTECPSCGVVVRPADSYCSECGEHLDPHRSSDDAGTSASGSADAAGSAAEPTREALAALSLTTRGRELTVSDGDTVGRRVRRIISDTSDDEAAVRIHREHVRFIRENGQFHVVDLGDNPTRVNDHQLDKGDRQPIGPGDELGLSGVVSLKVDRP